MMDGFNYVKLEFEQILITGVRSMIKWVYYIYIYIYVCMYVCMYICLLDFWWYKHLIMQFFDPKLKSLTWAWVWAWYEAQAWLD